MWPTLRLNDGLRLRDGHLGLQVFIDEMDGAPIGMNVQLRGMDAVRCRPWYLRYDLDSEQMGSNPVARFRAHWHVGDDPDADGAEVHDPRLPSLILDPIAVIETLIETVFPNGPNDVVDT